MTYSALYVQLQKCGYFTGRGRRRATRDRCKHRECLPSSAYNTPIGIVFHLCSSSYLEGMAHATAFEKLPKLTNVLGQHPPTVRAHDK